LTVDAAYKGTSWVCPELREEINGLKYIDCLLINFAKNLMMGMSGAVVFVKNKESWKEAHGSKL
jgi:glutamate/tyrosine decarboxylase-like PLP-dependent enzyme